MIPFIVCKWIEAGEEEINEPANWVVAWMCDRCDNEAVLEICDKHYTDSFIDGLGTPMKFGCPQCQGSVSWVARKMNSSIEDSLINDAGV
jgi:hypothetical protein